jgi:hypothetical protein
MNVPHAIKDIFYRIMFAKLMYVSLLVILVMGH